MKWSKYLFITIAFGAVAFLVLQYPSRQSAPMLKLTSLQGSTLHTVSSAAPTLVTFWATSCVTCVAETPDLKKLYTDLSPQGFRIIAIAMHYDNPDALHFFKKINQISYDIVHDQDGQLALAFHQVRVTPTHFLVSKEGRFLYQTIGKPDFKKLDYLIRNDLS